MYAVARDGRGGPIVKHHGFDNYVTGAAFCVMAAATGCISAAAARVPVVPADLDGHPSRHLVHTQCMPGIAADLGTAGGSSALDPERFRLLTWNVRKGRSDGWRDDFTRLAQGHDVVALQEASLTEQTVELLRHRAFSWRLSSSFRLLDVDTGVLTASRAPAEYSCRMRHAEPITRIPKSTLTTRHRIAGSRDLLLVANLHALNFTIGTSAFARQLREVAGVLAHHHGPAILAGDFNTWSESCKAVLAAIVAELGLAEVKPLDDRRTRFFGNTVDGVYYRGLEVIASATYDVTSSDHNPMSVSFRTLPSL